MRKVIIIGGGAAGMTAAIAAALNGAEVTILEHMDRIGKKILSTGNGKCNYTNRVQKADCYRSDNPAFFTSVLEQFGFEETIAFFKKLGIYPKEKNGYFYPASEQAAAVLDVLRMELSRLGVHIVTECQIKSVRKTKKGFAFDTSQGNFYSDVCIFACGGKAFPKSGSDGSAFTHIKSFGHSFVDVVPALVQLKAKQSFFKSIAGIRSDICVELYVDNRCVAKDRGEVQLTDCGISGIPVFQVSRYASRALKQGKKVKAALDFIPYLSKEELMSELKQRFLTYGGEKSCEEALVGLLQKKLIPLFLKENKIELKGKASKLSEENIKKLADSMKHFCVDITETKGFEAAQVTAGGVNTKEICEKTMESYLVKGLYFAGEVVDVDGICGGYNLQWAWSSGYTAGLHAAGVCRENLRERGV